jgi:hypothetical protein
MTAEKEFRRVRGYQHRWMHQAVLDEPADTSVVKRKEIA